MASRKAAIIAQVVEEASLFSLRKSSQIHAENRPKIVCLENLDSHTISMA
jgi:hypothetical protein